MNNAAVNIHKRDESMYNADSVKRQHYRN